MLEAATQIHLQCVVICGRRTNVVVDGSVPLVRPEVVDVGSGCWQLPRLQLVDVWRLVKMPALIANIANAQGSSERKLLFHGEAVLRNRGVQLARVPHVQCRRESSRRVITEGTQRNPEGRA